MLQELSDNELELVTGAGNTTLNMYINIIEINYSIVYAPVYVYGTVSQSNINSGNTYILNSGFQHR